MPLLDANVARHWSSTDVNISREHMRFFMCRSATIMSGEDFARRTNAFAVDERVLIQIIFRIRSSAQLLLPSSTAVIDV